MTYEWSDDHPQTGVLANAPPFDHGNGGTYDRCKMVYCNIHFPSVVCSPNSIFVRPTEIILAIDAVNPMPKVCDWVWFTLTTITPAKLNVAQKMHGTCLNDKKCFLTGVMLT